LEALRAGDHAKAREIYSVILAKNPTNDDAHVYLAQAYYLEGLEAIGKSNEQIRVQAPEWYSAPVSFAAGRASFGKAARSLRNVSPTNHQAVASADKLLFLMRRVLDEVSQIDGLGIEPH
jgi:hypothetical protein